eukprot:m.343217 g.343217  ORF g.343217 m.343217 type:complete len:458 (+) comp22529_c0_seq1:186-1559(+)
MSCLIVLAVICAPTALNNNNGTSIPIPNDLQLNWMKTPYRTFHHFGICTYSGCEHNSGTSGELPALFNPSEANPEQWVLAAKSLGAGGAVLTSRHEGGFCLFPSNFTNYTIAQSPLKGRDLVREFIEACNKHNIKPSLYFAASCDGYHKNYDDVKTAQEYVDIQLNTLKELVTTYKGIEYIWFDHHGNPPGHKSGSSCDFLSGCICDPLMNTFWHNVDDLMRTYAPDVLIGGIDLGIGPTNPPDIKNHFNACNFTDDSHQNTASRCQTTPQPHGSVFGDMYRPIEITSSAASKGWFWHPGTSYMSSKSMVDDYFSLIGGGYFRILNFPPNSTGLIDEDALQSMSEVGDALRSFYASEITRVTMECKSGDKIQLMLEKPSTVGAVMLKEDLANGQRVTSYNVSLLGGHWSASELTIGTQRIHSVSPTAGSNISGIQVECQSVVGTANVTIVGFYASWM